MENQKVSVIKAAQSVPVVSLSTRRVLVNPFTLQRQSHPAFQSPLCGRNCLYSYYSTGLIVVRYIMRDRPPAYMRRSQHQRPEIIDAL